MARFDDLSQYLYNTMLTMVNSQNLCKYLYYNLDHDANPVLQPDLSQDLRFKLILDKIYPLPRIFEDKLVEAASYVTVYFDNIQLGNNSFYKDSSLVFNIICHKDKWQIPSKLRPLEIMSEIDTLFNGKRDKWIGEMQFVKSSYLFVNKDYDGYTMKYRFVDFN